MTTILPLIRRVAALAALGLVGLGFVASSAITDARWLSLLGAAWLLLLVALWVPIPATTPSFNRGVVRTGIILGSVFFLLVVQVIRLQVIQSERITARVAVAPNGDVVTNGRLLNEDVRVRRGRITDRDGVILTDSVQRGAAWGRVYPEPESGYVVGYYAPLTIGVDGLEASYDDVLSGTAASTAWERWQRDVLHRNQQGADLTLTLDADLQRFAHELLGDRPGAAILVEVETGRVLTLASTPYYDANLVSAVTAQEAAASTEYYATLLADPALPLIQRATEALYTPGSIFKVITASAAIDLGFATPDRVYEDDGELDVEGRIIVENNRPDERTEWTLSDSLAWSLNVVFARVGLAVGAEGITDYSRAFGFGDQLPFDVPLSESQVASDDEFLESLPALADTSFGQGQLLANPLHMAMVAAAIANGGEMMRPYLVESVTARDGTVLDRTDPAVYRTPVSAATAAQVEEMMVGAVTTGYASAASVPGLRVGGKTGTAEVEGQEPHAWFIGFAGTDSPRYAVAVVLENAGAGMAGAQVVGRELLAASVGARSELAIGEHRNIAYVQPFSGSAEWAGASGSGILEHAIRHPSPGREAASEAVRRGGPRRDAVAARPGGRDARQRRRRGRGRAPSGSAPRGR